MAQVRAGESLMKLVADVKQYLILNDFPSVNDAIVQQSHLFKQKQAECDRRLMNLRDDISGDLFDLEGRTKVDFHGIMIN